jgi:VWFA-related protein
MILAAALISAVLQQQPPDRQGAVHEQALVERVVVDAHVVDPNGNPIPGLGSADFRVTVDGKPVLLESVDWLPADTPEIDATVLRRAGVDAGAAADLDAPPGRLIVLFFQTSHEPSRIVGLMRMAAQARRFLRTLLPTDRVAVVSHDSHLKLRQDFTDDRDRILLAINECLRTGREPEPEAGAHPSLAQHLDRAAARGASTIEEAFALIAHALEPIPGGKALIYFGWGMGVVGGMNGRNPVERTAWEDTLQGMAKARVNVFSLDVTDAESHSLEVYLEEVSDLTGGRYQKTHIFPALAMDLVGRAIAGRYVLVFVKPKAPRGTHDIDVALVGRKGTVTARRYYAD